MRALHTVTAFSLKPSKPSVGDVKGYGSIGDAEEQQSHFFTASFSIIGLKRSERLRRIPDRN